MTAVKQQSPSKRAFETMLSNEVRPFLKARGFTKNGHRFYRTRTPLYDQLGFQGNQYNNIRPFGFFINIGVGSTDVDAVAPGHGSQATPPQGFLLRDRWQWLVPGLPDELRFSTSTDMSGFAAVLCHNLDLVVTEFDKIHSTDALVQLMATRSKLLAYERTCRYLAAVGDTATLRTFVTRLRDTFGEQSRWAIFNDKLFAASGAAAAALVADGLLTAPAGGTP